MSNSTEAKYFDLHTTGIGYLNRIREVKPRKGSPFFAVTVAALKGKSDAVEYSYIDCNVVGAEAEKLIRRCQEAVAAEKKVLVSFRIGDIWADSFTYTKGEKQGQAGVSLKGRLLYIGMIKVDGQTVYEAKPQEVQHMTTPAESGTSFEEWYLGNNEIPDGVDVFETFTDPDGNELFCFEHVRAAHAEWVNAHPVMSQDTPADSVKQLLTA
ncbi:STY4534 family ICE replication protein [Pseudomonas sp. NPDC088368]|uniref:STY4534 family ICE replication protein n=1 Tax=Pseudomonas sp. NPDC088368 TaxID=3364453 RepID=UPI0037F2D7C8